MRRAALCGALAAVAAASATAAVYVCTPDNQPTRSGIPLGGMGCGTIEIRGDGAFHEWQIFNNMPRPVNVPEALFAVRMRIGGQLTAAALQLHPPAGLPGVGSIVYRGEFPYAWLKYDLRDVPAEVRLEAFTPFVPHDAEASGIPAAAFKVVVENRSADALEGQVAFFLPPAMARLGAGPQFRFEPLSAGPLHGASISTVVGEPARADRRVRVLLITDQPPASRRRVADILARVGNVELSVARIRDDRVALPSGDELRKRFDVIWLAELGRARDRLGPGGMAAIRDAVAAGCGFFYTGGWDSFYGHDEGRWARLNGTAIEQILPVVMLDRWDAVDRAAAARVVQVPEQLKGADLQHFPGVGGYNVVRSLKPGAQVVLQTADGKPLLVLGRFGRGRVAVYLSTPFGGWPRPWRGWPNFYGSLVAYLGRAGFIPATGTPADDPLAGSLTVAAVGPATVRRWDDISKAWAEFASSGDVKSSAGSAAVVIAPVRARPGQQAWVRFVLSWYFPNHRDRRGNTDGHFYATVYRSSRDVAEKLAARLDDLDRRSRRFHDALYNTPLPYWLADAINAQLSTFTKSSWWDRQGRFGIWEGMNWCCGLHTVDVSFYGSWPLVMLFPELQKDALRRTASFQRPSDGRIPHLFAGTFDAIDNYGRIDLPIQFILPVYREYLFTGDADFLRDMWPAVRNAANSVVLLDTNDDGLPEHTRPGDQTYDGWAIMGESAYIGSIWLAALRALEQMAVAVGQPQAAADYRALYEKARASYERLLWNGSYYRLWHDPKTGRKDEGLMLDAMCGQWYAHMLGLGWILPRDRVLSHLKACLNYNRLPVQRGMAYMVGDTGYCYVNCSWPGGKQRIGGQAGSPWTGTEYAFASLCIYSGLVQQGIGVVKDVYDRYYEAGMTWNHIECGGHYFRPMDIWTVLMALEGLRWDAPGGVLQIAPAWPAGKFRAPLVLPQGWGILTWTPGGRQAVQIRWLEGQVRVRQLIVPPAP